MTRQVLRADDHPRVPWANGRGVTHEVVSWPPGAADWDWRVSIAAVDEPGEFSVFAGIDRVLTVVAGGPMVLGVDGALVAAERLVPVAFPGDVATVCLSVSEPVRDVNVMTRRGAVTADVSVHEVRASGGTQPPSPLRVPAGGFLVAVVVRGTAELAPEGDLLTAYDAVLTADDLAVSGPATLVVARFEPVG